MKVAINLRQYRQGQIGGLENYVRNIVAGMVPLRDTFQEVTLFALEQEAANVREFAPGARVFPLPPSSAVQAIEGELAAGGYDLLFCPLLVLEPLRPETRSAVLIPDLQHEYHPGFFTPEVLAWRKRNYRPSAQHADVVFTISEYSKRTIVERLGIDPGKIVVVELDVDDEFRRPPSPQTADRFRSLGLTPEYIYYPANFWPHKNHANLVRALRLLVDGGHPELSLVLTGARHGLPEVEKQIAGLGLRKHVRVLEYQEREVVAEIYRHARALAFVSKFEGFGIPILEAFHTGVPVVCSASCSCPEVAGDAAVLVDENDPAAIAAGIARVLDDAGFSRGLVAGGRARTARYSWRRALAATVGALTRIPRQPPARIEVNARPLVSITTPSYNMARFIEATIQSVLSQDYPHIEYGVMDGGSTDGTLEILKKYEGRLRYVSQPDRGQADAINRGFAASSGQVFAFLNADDIYLPGAVGTAVKHLVANPRAGMVYGDAYYIDEAGERIGSYPTHAPDLAYLNRNCYICQPASFMWRHAFEDAGWMNVHQHLVLDYDLWMRMARLYPMHKIDEYLAASRMYRQNKTIGRRSNVYREILQSVKTHFGYIPFDWVFGYSCYLIDGKDQFFDKTHPSRAKYLLSLLLGAFYNPRQLRRYCAEWAVAAGIHPSEERWPDGWISKRYRGCYQAPAHCRAIRITGRNEGGFLRPLTLVVRLNGSVIAAERLERQGPFSIEAACPPGVRGKMATLQVTADQTFQPVGSADRRRLSCILDEIVFEER